MTLKERISLLVQLGQYMLSENKEWLETKKKAEQANNWFTSSFIDQSVTTIARQYLSPEALETLCCNYDVADEAREDKIIGLVTAGNIPLVGFHDFLCIFLAGYKMMVKASSKDEVLITHLVKKLSEWDARIASRISFTPMLKGADAYIATGSNNSGRYFDYYFKKYPHIIRRNRTSVAVLTGHETAEELSSLADDVHLYFGLGCRNVTKLYVPVGYHFVPLLEAFRKYAYFIDHHKYKNNFEYYLAISLLNNQYYMTNGSVLLLENSAFFSPISVLNYEYYSDPEEVKVKLTGNSDIQCVCGSDYLAFGQAQFPSVTDYADGIDTMQFLTKAI
jgi:hypothetical protein